MLAGCSARATDDRAEVVNTTLPNTTDRAPPPAGTADAGAVANDDFATGGQPQDPLLARNPNSAAAASASPPPASVDGGPEAEAATGNRAAPSAPADGDVSEE